MNIYLVEQGINNNYDTYDSFVCVAESEYDARQIHPSKCVTHVKNGKWMGTYSGGAAKGQEYEMDDSYAWISYSDAQTEAIVTFIGIADSTQKRGVILSSFNAG